MDETTFQMFDFSTAEINVAKDALEAFYQDHEMVREMMRIKDSVLIEQLGERGITRALAMSLIREMVAAHVYLPGRMHSIWREFVPFDGSPMISEDLGSFRHLYTTRQRMRKFFDSHRDEREHKRLASQDNANDSSVCQFRLKGEFREISFVGQTIYLRESVGLSYISRLLAEPNRHLPAVALLASNAGIDPCYASGGSSERLDGQARVELSRRYQDLRDDLADARDQNDLGRAEKLETELEQLTVELSHAIGLGGRSRKTDDCDRVRKSVSNAVVRAIEKIEKHHGPLASHLTTAIASGRTFCYAPERQVEWVV